MLHRIRKMVEEQQRRRRMPQEMANLCVDFLMCLRLWSRTHSRARKNAQINSDMLPQNKYVTLEVAFLCLISVLS